MKLQRTGLTEGSLLYNEWLKQFGLYRADTEAEFINWLYSTSGWYDKAIPGSYFDIDVEAVRKSENYQRFLREYREAMLGSDWFHLMLHSSWHLNGLDKQAEFAKQFSETNKCYWKDVPFLNEIVGDQRVLVISSIAPLIIDKYWNEENELLGYQAPQTHLNTGTHDNSWKTLDKMTRDIEQMKDWFDFAIVSCGAYGVLLTDRIVKMGKSAATVGSGIYDIYPVDEIPDEFKPKGWEKVEEGRYWTQNGITPPLENRV